ncbi:hypothetical protein D3C84_1208840 [compost metagenome]
MEFYKHATEDDFIKALDDPYVPDFLMEMIQKENKVSHKMVRIYNEYSLLDMQKCENMLKKYLSIVNAYNDFKNGKTVFAKY